MADLLLALGVIWLAAKAAGEGMERLGQTAVLGELIVGVLLGPHVLGVVNESEVLHALAEIGAILLLFEVGLESELTEFFRVGAQAAVVAVAGIVCPFALGYLFARWSAQSEITAVFLGATLTATSVGITARVLSDLGRLHDSAARVVVGAAVIDDVLGLVILAAVTGLARTGGFSAVTLTLILVKALAFLGLALAIGLRFAPALLRLESRMQVRGSLIGAALVFCVLLSAAAEKVGLATIVGAFAAGLLLASTERRAHIQNVLKPVTDLFVPVFFVVVGMKVDPSMLNPFGPAGWAGVLAVAVLTVLAVLGKLVCGLAVYQKAVRAWPVAVGMVPRGEVGLIFAGIGLSSGVLDSSLYASVVAMVMLTTFIVPLWLRAVYRERHDR
ncbi:MAG TPA: cation:proton antiporter [Methylomirabilota bacterium]|nr:cation:proton antiporter [Methylomirabilota bacterium]